MNALMLAAEDSIWGLHPLVFIALCVAIIIGILWILRR